MKPTEGLESHEADTLSAVSVVPYRDGAEGNITVRSDKIKICPCSAECTKNICLNRQKRNQKIRRRQTKNILGGLRLAVNRRYIYIISNNYQRSFTNEKWKAEKQQKSHRTDSSPSKMAQMLWLCLVSTKFGHFILPVSKLCQIQARVFIQRGKR